MGEHLGIPSKLKNSKVHWWAAPAYYNKAIRVEDRYMLIDTGEIVRELPKKYSLLTKEEAERAFKINKTGHSNPNSILYDAHTPVVTYNMIVDSIYHSTYSEVDQEAMASLLEDFRSTSPVFL